MIAATLAKSRIVYANARGAKPERWQAKARNWRPTGAVLLNPERETSAIEIRDAALNRRTTPLDKHRRRRNGHGQSQNYHCAEVYALSGPSLSAPMDRANGDATGLKFAGGADIVAHMGELPHALDRGTVIQRMRREVLPGGTEGHTPLISISPLGNS